MKVMEAEFAKEFIRLCEDGWKKGWHEYHGGNLSYRLSTEEIEQVRDGLSQNRAGWVTMEREYPVLVMTGAGATYPYGKDPKDSNIRIAPSFPTTEDLEKAAQVFVVCVKLASVEKLLAD